jgi:hypothetical protein
MGNRHAVAFPASFQGFARIEAVRRPRRGENFRGPEKFRGLTAPLRAQFA